jgi:hypothetical protein
MLGLGYFATDFKVSSITAVPDLGKLPADPAVGVSCIGVVPLVVNFNMVYRAGDSKANVAKVGTSIREAGLVQSLTLDHAHGSVELACNLLNVKIRSCDEVLSRAKLTSHELGCTIEKWYTTGPTEEELVTKYLTL